MKNNIVVIGDIETHDTPNYGRFPTGNLAKNLPDFAPSLAAVANFEKGTATYQKDGQSEKSNKNAPNPYPFGEQFGIAGTAYWAHTQDIRGNNWTIDNKDTTRPVFQDKRRPGLRVNTFAFDVNAYGNQSDATNRHYKNQFFLAAKYGGFRSLKPKNKLDPLPYNTWGNPFVTDDGLPQVL